MPGGGRDFIRPVTRELCGIPREEVIGSASTLEYVSGGYAGTVSHKAQAVVSIKNDWTTVL